MMSHLTASTALNAQTHKRKTLTRRGNKNTVNPIESDALKIENGPLINEKNNKIGSRLLES